MFSLTPRQLPQITSSSLGVVSKDGSSSFQFTLDNPRLTQAQRAFYEQNGFLVIPNLVPHDKIDRWRERFLDLVEGRQETGGMTKMKDISLKGVQGVSGERVVNKIQDFVWDDILSEHCQLPQVLDYVECFTGPNIMAMHTMLINKPPDPGTLHLPPPHAPGPPLLSPSDLPTALCVPGLPWRRSTLRTAVSSSCQVHTRESWSPMSTLSGRMESTRCTTE
ncbi:hypothetical protein O3P69_016704 [Scylla paramamosain]|uniref:phytanoyl-CoA dioxygenase n=1 Tax=Scylla paramamosain TaxID=85552 RepID=A0AAW0SZ39_SCYPA